MYSVWFRQTLLKAAILRVAVPGGVCCFLTIGCTPLLVETVSETGITLQKETISDLPGWADDDMAGVMDAFGLTCAGMIEAVRDFRGAFDPGSPQAWEKICAAGKRVASDDENAVRAFFETYFTAYRLGFDNQQKGLLTGYYEPQLSGSRYPTSRYNTPLYGRPEDLISVNLGHFRRDWQGERLAGRLENNRLMPYPSRAEIVNGALAGRGLELLWVDDPVEAFFLQVQGSGRVILSDGRVVRVTYAGSNGHVYVSIGRELVRRGAMVAEDVSLESIRRWLSDHPQQAEELLNMNPSYIFFREVPPLAHEESMNRGPVGAAGVPLTSGRSLAIDDALYPYGLPMWIDGQDPLDTRQSLQRLTFTQDTGGALRGGLRGDLFWGYGRIAEKRAGYMRDQAAYYIFLPGIFPEQDMPPGQGSVSP